MGNIKKYIICFGSRGDSLRAILNRNEVMVVDKHLIDKAFGLRREFNAQVRNAFCGYKYVDAEILTDSDIAGLPGPIQKYIRYTGAIGKEKVKNFSVTGEGEFKTGKDKNWVKATSRQYNFVEDPCRIYYMQLKMFGIPVVGLHIYKNAIATMRIKFAGLVTVADAKGDIMNKSETVTVFNDMCLMAPATLIDKRITWEPIDDLSVQATFKNHGVQISAVLYFNEDGAMVNFVSNDRYMTTSGETYLNAPWWTPVRDYEEYQGVRIASYGEACWSLPEGDYCYGRMHMKEVQYNTTCELR